VAVKRVAILGATGSVGRQALEVVEGHPGLEVVALSAHVDADGLLAAAVRHDVPLVALTDREAARSAVGRSDARVLEGPDGLLRLVHEAEADVVLNAVVGAAGLPASLAVLEAGADLALANKESLVAGGPLVLAALRGARSRLLPVDSEHSALLQCLGDAPSDAVESLVLTASGGPFRGRTAEDLADVRPDDALAHPTWSMGAKVTIDSATLMNKGLEVIEAHLLFGTPYDRIDVVVHPQSLIHALVTLCDGAALAHMGHPDMRVPIAYALHHPERVDVPVRPLDLAEIGSLTFERPDVEAFPCLRLAREAAETAGTAPCILNAANEVAVHAFLGGRLPFMGIAEVIERTLDRVPSGRVHAFETLYAADARAREAAAGLVTEVGAAA
jgi:1-deoxy-D-xylulose-5-phosphate reductoisomerase